jgi:hypothetical protein
VATLEEGVAMQGDSGQQVSLSLASQQGVRKPKALVQSVIAFACCSTC